MNHAIDKLSRTGAQCLLFISFRRLKSDTYQNTALIYDIEASVLDARGQRIAFASKSGRDNLGGSMWNPASYAEQAAPEGVEHVLERLLDEREILDALGEEEHARPVPRS